jgi:hypothetical protein
MIHLPRLLVLTSLRVRRSGFGSEHDFRMPPPGASVVLSSHSMDLIRDLVAIVVSAQCWPRARWRRRGKRARWKRDSSNLREVAKQRRACSGWAQFPLTGNCGYSGEFLRRSPLQVSESLSDCSICWVQPGSQWRAFASLRRVEPVRVSTVTVGSVIVLDSVAARARMDSTSTRSLAFGLPRIVLAAALALPAHRLSSAS